MTTTVPVTTTFTGVRVILGSAAAVLVAGVVLAGFAALVADHRGAALSAALGTGIALVTFAGGLLALDVVARLLPSASLLFALLTYTCQVVVLFAVFSGLSETRWWDSVLAPRWLAAGVIFGCLTWMVAQIILFVRARIPAFEAGAS